MAAQFSEGWSGTPMWQLTQGIMENQKKEQENRKTQAGSVLSIENEGDGFRSVLFIARLVDKNFQDSKVRGVRRKRKAEAIQDGLELRDAYQKVPEDSPLETAVEAVLKRRVGLLSTTWREEELTPDDYKFEEKEEEPMRKRLMTKPRGNGWQRVGDKEFFRHSSAPMAFDPVKGRYLQVDTSTNTYIESPLMPHDPMEYAISVNVGSSLVGQTDEDLNAGDRPRTLLLKELIKTGAAMKNPLFFLDSPAACFALFDGIRGGAAVEWCSKHFHTKLIPQLSAQIVYWSEDDVRSLLVSILKELDVQMVQQPGCCWEGVSIAIALVLGDRAVVVSLGGVHALVIPPDGKGRALDGHHRGTSGEEKERLDVLGGEVLGTGGPKGLGIDAPLVQKRVRSREWQIAEGSSTEDEVRRILDATFDAFATLGLGPEDNIDGKTARSSYKKLALKVHPDKAPAELKTRAKEAFEKIERAAATIETFSEVNTQATSCLQQILHAAGGSGPCMSRATALAVLGLEEGASVEEAGTKGRELREQIVKLGILSDGSFGHPDQEEAVRMIEEAAEAIAEPAALTASKGGESFSALKPVHTTRGLGMRDLKLPRQLLTNEPQVDFVALDKQGAHHLVLLSSGAQSLSDEEVISRVWGFARQPKAASLLVAMDSAARNAKRGTQGVQRFGSCVVGVFEVEKAKKESEAKQAIKEPAAKKAKKDTGGGGEKVRARHILLKHKDLKLKMDPQAHLRTKGPITRPLAQAERELLRLKETISKDLNQFPALARKHSECKSALQPGQMAGDLGWISKGSLNDPVLEDVVFNLEMHELSDLVVSARGVSIVQRIA
eukprot:TRINITY_DN33089_c0_g1_i1.p1 TRINITY_DN33089_c0_g1~~TRINITY_DN33089_c0_g1_i1.p1  ORF type:complete len:835 (-),score=195.05 TRINITY_DN33089_c0_g1_i1:33-2537(-)